MNAPSPLRALLVGCGRMGRSQTGILKEHRDFELVGVCDVFEESARRAGHEFGVPFHTDLAQALSVSDAETVSVCTDNASHAAVTVAAARMGVRGVYCEKPMATNMRDAREMVDVCRETGTVLVINHQRRVGDDLRLARQSIEDGVLGEISLLRGNCAGDVLSDGTHLVDSLLWLCGDPDPVWVMGQVHREIDDAMRERARAQSEKSGRPVEPGTRYGHPVENGAMGVVSLSNGIRMELFCGDLREDKTAYQEYVVTGTKGRLWRTGDQMSPNLFLQTAEPGDRDGGLLEWSRTAVPAQDGPGQWCALEVVNTGGRSTMERAYSMFAESVRTGEPHPMAGEVALHGFEIVMAIYESARAQRLVHMPLEQDRFPLEVMIEEQSSSPTCHTPRRGCGS